MKFQENFLEEVTFDLSLANNGPEGSMFQEEWPNVEETRDKRAS